MLREPLNADGIFGDDEPPGDRDLTLAFQRGEKGAYQSIHDRYVQRVEGLCYRMLGNRHDAQEATQETFIRVYQALARFNGRYQLGAWITRIATNVCLDQLRSRARTPHCEPLEELDLEPDRTPVDQPDEIIIRRAAGRRVRKVLDSLPPLHRAAMVLRDLEGLSYQEVATALDLSETQVKALLHRARQGFKRSWGSVLGAFLPARLLQRMRGLDVVGRDQVVQPFSNVAPWASSCGTALQHCGQYVVDKVAPIAVVMAVGAGSVLSSGTVDEPAHAGLDAVRTSSHEAGTSAGSSPSRRARTVPRELAEAAPPPRSEAPSETAPEPAAEPTPVPTSAPPSEPDPATGGEGAPPEAEPTEDPPPTPPDGLPLLTAYGFSRGGPLSAIAPQSGRSDVDCDGLQLEQTLSSEIADGSARYQSRLTLKSAPDPRFALTVWKDGYVVTYLGSNLQTGWEWDGDGAQRTFWLKGTYSDTGNAADTGLPQTGQISARLGVDCADSSVITESVVLGT